MLFITFIDNNIINKDNYKLFKKSTNDKIIYIKVESLEKNEEKINKLLEYLKNNTNKNDIICYTNVNNSFFNNNLDEIQTRYLNMETTKILFSNKNQNNKIDEVNNSFIGYSYKIIELFEKICEKYNCRYHNTGYLIQKYKKFCEDCIIIDKESYIFLNINNTNIYSLKIYKNNIIFDNKIPIIVTYYINKNLINYLNNLLEQINLPKLKNYYETKIYSDKTGKMIYHILKYTHFLIVLLLYFSVFFTNNLYYLIFLFCINFLVYIQWYLLKGCFWTKWENYYEKLFYIDYKYKDTDLESSNIKRLLKNYFNIPFETSEFIMNRLPLTVCFISLIKIYIYHLKK